MRIDGKVRSQAANLEDRVGRDSGQTEVDMELDRVLRVARVSEPADETDLHLQGVGRDRHVPHREV